MRISRQMTYLCEYPNECPICGNIRTNFLSVGISAQISYLREYPELCHIYKNIRPNVLSMGISTQMSYLREYLPLCPSCPWPLLSSIILIRCSLYIHRKHTPQIARITENNKLKNDKVLFLREKHNSFCRGTSKVILKDSPFNFGRFTSIIDKDIELFHTYQIGCAFCGDIARGFS